MALNEAWWEIINQPEVSDFFYLFIFISACLSMPIFRSCEFSLNNCELFEFFKTKTLLRWEDICTK